LRVAADAALGGRNPPRVVGPPPHDRDAPGREWLVVQQHLLEKGPGGVFEPLLVGERVAPARDDVVRAGPAERGEVLVAAGRPARRRWPRPGRAPRRRAGRRRAPTTGRTTSAR